MSKFSNLLSGVPMKQNVKSMNIVSCVNEPSETIKRVDFEYHENFPLTGFQFQNLGVFQQYLMVFVAKCRLFMFYESYYDKHLQCAPCVPVVVPNHCIGNRLK